MFTFRALILSFALVATASAQQAKRPLHHRDYDGWRSIPSQALSRDGKFLAYALFPEDGDGELVVKDLTTGKEFRENAGALPPAPDNTNFETPAAEQTAARSIRIVFTHDNRFVVASAFPSKSETDKARKEKKRADEMPRNSMVIVDLAALTAARVPDAASFQIPELGDSYVAYLKGPKPGERSAPTENDADDLDQRDQRDQRRVAASPASGALGARKQFGSDLMLRDLRTSKERSFEDVLEYALSKDAKALVYTVSSTREDSNGVYSIVPGADGSPAALLAGKGRYTKLTWDFSQRELAFLSDRDDAAGKPAKFKAYAWDRSGAPIEIVSTSTAGFRSGYAILDRGPMSFSRDGSRLFLSCAPMEEIAALDKESSASSDDHVLADLWHWKDDYVQPMQKVRAPQERSRSYRAVLSLSDKKFIQLSDPAMPGLIPSDDGRVAIGTDDRAYRHMVDFDGTYNDVYLVDTVNGSRKLALKQYRGNVGGGGRGGGGSQLSPDGRHLLAFKDQQWWSIQVPDGAAANLTGKLGAAFFNEDHDTPDEPPSYGTAGWTKDGKWALVYDRYDVWTVSPDGAAARKLTNGRGSELQFRVARLDSADDEEERGIDPAKPLFFRAENLHTRDSGIYSLANLMGALPQRLIMGPKNYRVLGKAKDADVVMVTATTFHDQPDIQITDSTFRQMKKVTDANPQQTQILWGTSELIRYRNADGVELDAALYKPENFDSSKKYPMLIYIYERLSQNLHNFVRPGPGTSINIAYYVSNGYLVLTPDIVYTTGHPGQSALKCVLPAIQAVVDKGYVDRARIGIQGHSWGGYQAAYLLTQTNVFRAAEAGAPVANMISAYDGIRWGTGLPRQFQYEKTQSRIGGSIWEYPMRFIENSPIFMVDRVTTPLLILENDGDDAVPWYQGLELFLSLRRLGKEVYLWNYNGEAHGLRKRPTQKDYTVRMQQFFDHFLKGVPAPEWMEKGVPYIEREHEKEKISLIYGETVADDKKKIR
ncbi:MAG TPA: prolyl oligopeptidase family serine peptidase [Bryobacteraceae bacterium]|nr:prolyl oligopeptidase family serine peptidase [Bryobacteraceae bacterium]